jgi:hypothetical protein
MLVNDFFLLLLLSLVMCSLFFFTLFIEFILGRRGI